MTRPESLDGARRRPPATAAGVPFVSPFAIPELVDGVYPTAAFLNDARRDAEQRDAATLAAAEAS